MWRCIVLYATTLYCRIQLSSKTYNNGNLGTANIIINIIIIFIINSIVSYYCNILLMIFLIVVIIITIVIMKSTDSNAFIFAEN